MEHGSELQEFVISSARELGLKIGNVHAEHFMRYLTHLLEWNKTINLTAIIDPKEIIIKHFIDSLTPLIATNLPRDSSILDVGSGAGFPGIPLKIVRPDIQLILVESIQKKCGFINSMIGLLKLHNVSVFNGTVEQYASRPIRQAVDTVVVRALKFDEIRKSVTSLLTSKGKIILYRTSAIEKQEIGEDFHVLSETSLMLPGETGRRVITVIEQ